MPCVSLQSRFHKFQEESSDLETQLLELGFLCENPDDVGSASANFSYNAHGSMASMPHLSAMDWDFAEKLCHITRGTTEAYYNYDGGGIRTRKVVEKNGVVETRLYLGGFEIWRKTVNGVLDTERETLHVMDDQRRIALVETLTVENGNAVANPLPVLRYQLDNHLGSASLELDESASIISYEEYYPYGDTSYRAGRNASEVSRKRYRYTGKEKDEESSLYYCEQRYYAAHISRWGSTDPMWLEDGVNLYAYVHGNPVSGVDPSGTQTEELNYKYEAYPTEQTIDLPNVDIKAIKKYDEYEANESLKDEINVYVEQMGGVRKSIYLLFDWVSNGQIGVNLLEKRIADIYEMIDNGSFENEIYKNVDKPGLDSGKNPTFFKDLIGSDLYYFARARDYQRRNNTNDIPTYYNQYGAKNMFRFKYITRNVFSMFSDDFAENWLDKTLKNLQVEMEGIVLEDSESENLDVDNLNSNYKKAFNSHVPAYVDAGFCELNIAEWAIIGITPDVNQIFEGVGQIKDVVAECGPVKPFTNFITRPLSRGIRELNSMYNNFLQRSILQQLR
jgi:RHS repeat-associated protein